MTEMKCAKINEKDKNKIWEGNNWKRENLERNNQKQCNLEEKWVSGAKIKG